MKTKKIISMIVTSVLSLAMLASCGGTGSDSSGTTNGDAASATAGSGNATSGSSEGEVVLNVWYHWMSEQRKPTIDGMIQKFNEENAGKIKVVGLGVPYNDIRTKFTAAVAAGEAPDAIVQPIETVAVHAENQYCEDLTEYLPSNIKDNFLDNYWYTTQYNERTYALPFNTDTRFIFYNKDKFTEAGITEFPKTWDEMFAAADKLDKKASDGSYETYTFLPTLGNFGFDTIAFGNGGSKYDLSNINIPTYNSPQNIEAATFMQKWVQRYGQQSYDAMTTNTDQAQQANDPFITGKIAMRGEVMNYIATLEKYAPDMNYGIAPLPAGPSANGELGAAGGGFVWEVGKGTKHIAEAAKFVEFITGEWATTKWGTEQKDLMLNKKANDAIVQSSGDIWKQVVDLLPYTHVTTRSNYNPDTSTIDNEMLDSIMKNGVDPKTALDQAQDELSQMMKDNGDPDIK